VPALGGKIRDITLAGRQWLWHNPDSAFAVPAEGAPYPGAADCGGFDDCLPTLAECLIPTWVQGVRTRQLPEHGELWSQQPHLSIAAGEGGPSATCTWIGAALPYRFSRTIGVRLDGSLAFDYALTNTGSSRMPFVWSSFPVLPLTAETRIVLPEGSRTRVWAQHGITIGRPGSEHRWPRMRVGSSMVDLSHPSVAQRDDYACKLFVDLPRSDAVIALEEGDVRLEMHVDGRLLTRAGVWINRRGWPPAGAKSGRRWSLLGLGGSRTPANVMLGPCLGAPDSLSEALGAWDDAHWIEPGLTTRWSMTWRGSLIEPSDGA
jgi:hypothetical protein